MLISEALRGVNDVAAVRSSAHDIIQKKAVSAFTGWVPPLAEVNRSNGLQIKWHCKPFCSIKDDSRGIIPVPLQTI
jgi:hypothetical protein